MVISREALCKGLDKATCIDTCMPKENCMTQEELDFIYFRDNQLKYVDYSILSKKYWSKISNQYF